MEVCKTCNGKGELNYVVMSAYSYGEGLKGKTEKGPCRDCCREAWLEWKKNG